MNFNAAKIIKKILFQPKKYYFLNFPYNTLTISLLFLFTPPLKHLKMDIFHLYFSHFPQ